jgi:PIN domain nuclease of toxin-antitoxin system
MKLLLDTHLILWGAAEPKRFSPRARMFIDDSSNEFVFSAVSMWEVAIKRALGKPDFAVEPRVLRRGLLDRGFTELPITSEHAMYVVSLPTTIHKDPFDRLLIAQATVEGIILLTSDVLVAQYPGPIQRV